MKITFTKEPGSWVMFAIAFITGVIKGGAFSLPHLVLLASLSFFLMAKAPVATLLRSGDRSVIPPVAAYLIISIAGCFFVLSIRPPLAPLFAAGAVFIVLFFIFSSRGYPVLSEAAGMAMMGLAAILAASVNTVADRQLYLGVMFFLFYFASSFRVRFTTRRYRVLSGLFSALLIIGGAGLAVASGRFVYLSFLPLAEDIISAATGRRDDFRRLGIIETVKSVAFALFVVLIPS